MLLSEVYESQLEQVYQDEILRRLNDTRQGFQLGAWNCLLYLVGNDITWAVEMAEEYWPTNARSAIGNSWPEHWFQEKWLGIPEVY